MARKPSGRPTGRPLKEFDKKVFESSCQILCTWNEIENILDGNRETIANWCKRTYGEDFSTIYNKFSAGGKASLRRNQINLSKTNAAMCIWLGKQWLGQKDHPIEEKLFDGKLAELLEMLSNIKTEREFKRSESKEIVEEKAVVEEIEVVEEIAEVEDV